VAGRMKIALTCAAEPDDGEPPWEPSRENLAAIDRHFWDWTLWLRSKEASGKTELLATELEKLFQHLLAPLGATTRPASVAEAVAAYREARDRAELGFGCRVPRDLESAVADAVAG